MSHFYGVLQGNRGQTTRCGSKLSGIHTTAASWSGAIDVDVYYDDEKGKDVYIVVQRPWKGRGVSKVIASGVIGDE